MKLLAKIYDIPRGNQPTVLRFLRERGYDSEDDYDGKFIVHSPTKRNI